MLCVMRFCIHLDDLFVYLRFDKRWNMDWFPALSLHIWSTINLNILAYMICNLIWISFHIWSAIWFLCLAFSLYKILSVYIYCCPMFYIVSLHFNKLYWIWMLGMRKKYWIGMLPFINMSWFDYVRAECSFISINAFWVGI